MATGTKQKDMVLLWTNPSPNSSFSPQTISVDTSTYDCVLVDVIASVNSSSAPQDGEFHASFVIAKGLKTNVNTSTYGQGRMVARDITVNNNGIVFGDGVYPGTAVDNNLCRPYKIWGIKA